MDNLNNNYNNNQQPQYSPQQQYNQQQYNQQYAQQQYNQQYAQQYGQYDQQYAQQYYQQPERPAIQLPTNRGVVKALLLTLITFGIYALVVMGRISNEVNVVCSKYDGKKTTNFWVMTLILTPLTCGIYGLVWYHKLYNRIGDELRRRNIDYSFGAGTYWGWNVLGILILVGPIIGLHKLFVAMNKMNADYNERG